MAEEERCRKHDMIPTMCADCRGLGSAVDPDDPYDDVVVERFFVARYTSRCALVDDHEIRPGTEIAVVVRQNGEGVGYACAGCVVTLMRRVHESSRKGLSPREE